MLELLLLLWHHLLIWALAVLACQNLPGHLWHWVRIWYCSHAIKLLLVNLTYIPSSKASNSSSPPLDSSFLSAASFTDFGSLELLSLILKYIYFQKGTEIYEIGNIEIKLQLAHPETYRISSRPKNFSPQPVEDRAFECRVSFSRKKEIKIPLKRAFKRDVNNVKFS